MSILSSIGSGISSAWNWVKNAASDVASTITGKSQSAATMNFNVGNNLNGYGSTAPKATSQSNGITYYNNYVPIPSSLNGPMTVNPALVNPPKTISTGVSNTSASTNYSPVTGYSNTSQFTIQPSSYTAPKTLTSSMLTSSSPIISTPQTNLGSVNTVGNTSTLSPSVARIMSDNTSSNIIPMATRLTTPYGQNARTTQGKDAQSKDTQTKDMQTLIDEQSRIAPPQVNYEDLYRQARQESGVESKQLIVNDLSNRLNEINNRVNGDILRLRSVGAKEGVTEAVYGQQVAEIAREGQLQTLPIEAQLNAARGDLQMAQNNLDTLYKVKSSQAESNFKRWTNIVDNAREVFSKQEQRQIDDMKTKFAYNSSRIKDSTDFAQQVALEALKNGNPQYVSLLTGLREPDPTSETFNEDLQAYNKQVSKYASQIGIPTSGYAGAPTDGQAGVALYSGLSNATATAVRSKVSKFSTEPLVQNFATIQEGKNFASSIPDKTTNPADDQGLIYSLAKVLDPGSVVREGEYATAQKYSQSWVKAFGKSVTQAINGSGFLSEEARKNIKSTIESKYKASEKSYKNLQSSYTEGINKLTGRTNGSDFLIEYAIPDSNVVTNNIELTGDDNAKWNSLIAPSGNSFKFDNPSTINNADLSSINSASFLRSSSSPSFNLPAFFK